MRSRPSREHGHQQGEGGRRGERAADALDGAGGEQLAGLLGEAAGERGEGEQRDAGEEDPAAAEQVTGAGAEQQQAAEGQGVGVDDPGQAGRGEAEGGLDVGQRDVHDRRVEHDHQLAGQDEGEDEAGVAGGAAARSRRRPRAGCGQDSHERFLDSSSTSVVSGRALR